MRVLGLARDELGFVDVVVEEHGLELVRVVVLAPEDGDLVEQLLAAEVGVHRVRGHVHLTDRESELNFSLSLDFMLTKYLLPGAEFRKRIDLNRDSDAAF